MKITTVHRNVSQFVEHFEQDVLIYEAIADEWQLRAAGSSVITVASFEVTGTADNLYSGNATIERVFARAGRPSGEAWLYVRQPWTTDGDKAWGRFGFAVLA